MGKPQNTVTEITACSKCGAVNQWKMYKRRGTKRYYKCASCGQNRIDRVIVKLLLIRSN